jgi:hypothetical protein
LNKNRRLIIVILITCFLFSNSGYLTSAETSDDEENSSIFVRLFRLARWNQEFNQYLEIEYNTTIINERLQIEESLNVPIEFTYWTDLADSVKRFRFPLNLLPFMFQNIVIYGMGMPQQSIILNVTSKPSWLNCNFLIDTIPVDIPTFNNTKYQNRTWSGDQEETILWSTHFPDEDKLVIRTSLVISPLVDAPAQQYSIGISAYLKSMGMIKEAFFQEELTFTPSFFPKIDFDVGKPLQFSSPQKSVNFPITIKNTANKNIQIIPKISNHSQYNGEINPEICTLYPNESTLFYFSKFTDNKFGWHDSSEEYCIDFYVKLAPFPSNITYGPYPIILSLHTYGFSTSGFDLILMSIGFFGCGT